MILTPSLTVPWIVLGLLWVMSPVRAPWLSLGCLMLVVWWIFGAAFTRLLRVSLGVGGTVPSPPGLTYLAALIPGLPRLRPVIFFLCFGLLLVVLPFSSRHVLFGFDPDELRVVPNDFVYMLNVCKFFSWHARNDFRFRGVQPGAIVVIEEVKSRVRFHLSLLFKRFKSSRHRRYFGRQWGARGIIGSVTGSRLIIHL